MKLIIIIEDNKELQIKSPKNFTTDRNFVDTNKNKGILTCAPMIPACPGWPGVPGIP